MANYPSYIAELVNPQNFAPQLSAKITTSGTSSSVTFTVTGTQRNTFFISNKGAYGAYIGWGHTSATAVASSGTPAANCQYIGSGCVLTLDFQLSNGAIVDTIAAIQGSDTQDAGATILEISTGSGQ